MKPWAFYFLFCLPLLWACHAGPNNEYKSAAVYVSAHHDDWQLFMGSNFFADAQDLHKKVVLVVTTSGCFEPGKFCAVRIAGLGASIKYITDLQAIALKADSGFLSFQKFSIPFYRHNNITVLLLNLPDGNTTGEGFERFGNRSLSKFRKGDFADLFTTDSANVFHHWDQLIEVLGGVVRGELNSCKGAVTLHLPDTSMAINPLDHPDHYSSAYLALKAFAGQRWKRFFYSQYQNEFLPDNLSGADSVHQTGLFDAYNNTVTREWGECTTCYSDV